MSESPQTTANDENGRDHIWHREAGEPWAAFDHLPPAIRRRLMEHAYEPWPTNALSLWRHYKRVHGAGPRAERALMRYLDYCERLEQAAFATHRTPLPHVAAGATILRYSAAITARRAPDSTQPPAAPPPARDGSE